MWEMVNGNDHRKVQIVLDSKPNDSYRPIAEYGATSHPIQKLPYFLTLAMPLIGFT